MRPLILPAIFTAATLAAGCTGTVGYQATVSSDAYQPDLVYAAPGVQVIADYDEPIFYSDSYYWRNDGGTWSRSTSYGGGWVNASPPQVIVQIRQPERYAHYRPQGWTPRPSREPSRAVDHRRVEPRPEANRQPAPVRQAPPGREPPPPHRNDRGHADDHRKR